MPPKPSFLSFDPYSLNLNSPLLFTAGTNAYGLRVCELYALLSFQSRGMEGVEDHRTCV